MTNDMQIRGRVVAELFGPDGQLKERREAVNIVTNVGRAHVVDRLQAAGAAVCDYIAIGTGSTSPAAADTTLEAEVARDQGTLSQPDAYTERCVYTFAAGVGTGTITEAGRLNNSTGGTLMGRSTFSGITKGSGDSLQFTYDFTYAAS